MLGCKRTLSNVYFQSLNDESFQWDDNQDAEIIRRLQKEILQLQRAHSLLQAQTGSSVDVKRAQLVGFLTFLVLLIMNYSITYQF